jgi:hypothetical protein
MSQGRLRTKAYIGMTDKDPIEKVARVFGGNVNGPYKSRGNRKPFWTWQLYGSRAASFLMTIYPLLGSRRQKAVKSALDNWKKTTAYANFPGWCRNGAHNLKEVGKYKDGKCKACARQRRKESKQDG